MNPLKNRPSDCRIRKAVRSVRDDLGPAGRPFTETDFFAICAKRGIEVLQPGKLPAFDAAAPALGSVRGFALKTPAGPLIVVLSLFRGEPFNLRTAAHELGHLVLGHLDAPAASDPFAGDPQNEKEADAFANLLLSVP